MFKVELHARGMHPRARIAASAGCLAVALACRYRPVGFDVRGLVGQELRDYQEVARTADVVIVGRLVSFDRDWKPYSGVAASCANLTFRVSEVLRGPLEADRITVENYMVGPGLWVDEKDSRGGLRLSQRFFVRGAEYIVFIDHRYEFCGNPSLTFVCTKSESNFAAVRADLRGFALHRHVACSPLTCASSGLAPSLRSVVHR